MTHMFSLRNDAFVMALDVLQNDQIGRNFVTMLEREYNAAPVFIDANAFSHVCTEEPEPFMMLASAVYAKIREDASLAEEAKIFLTAAAKIGKKLLPDATDLSLKTFTNGLAAANPVEAIRAAKDATDSIMQERLAGYAEHLKNVADFKQALAAFAQAHRARTTKRENFPHDMPLIVFIDELYR